MPSLPEGFEEFEDENDIIPGDEGTGAEGEGEEDETPVGWLKDLTEDDVYDRIQRAGKLPEHLSGLESRFTGSLSELQQKLSGIEKSLGTRTTFNTEKLTKVLTELDPKLAEVLVPALAEAFQVHPLDEASLSPYLDPMSSQMKEFMGQQLVLGFYPPDVLEEIIPPIANGKFAPEGQRHKDFVEWYSQQGYQTQQALLNFGAPYVHALKKFESWEKGKNEERAAKSGGKTDRLARGKIPTSRTTRTGRPVQTNEETFLAAFDEVAKEGM